MEITKIFTHCAMLLILSWTISCKSKMCHPNNRRFHHCWDEGQKTTCEKGPPTHETEREHDMIAFAQESQCQSFTHVHTQHTRENFEGPVRPVPRSREVEGVIYLLEINKDAMQLQLWCIFSSQLRVANGYGMFTLINYGTLLVEVEHVMLLKDGFHVRFASPNVNSLGGWLRTSLLRNTCKNKNTL